MRRSHLTPALYTGKSSADLRGHVLDDAVDKVKALVVVRLGGNKLLKDSEQTRLRGKSKHLNAGKGKKTTVNQFSLTILSAAELEIEEAPFSRKAWSSRTRGGMFPVLSHRTGWSKWGNKAM